MVVDCSPGKSASVALRSVGLLLIILLAAMNCVAAETKKFRTLAQTEQGAVDGFAIADFQTVAWLGIPYAQPPVGPLRWKSPKDPVKRTQTLEARSYGSPCFQPGTKSSEDCLYLNVWRPSRKQRRLPVLVYIHGGANIYGSGEGSWQAAAHFYNVVVVTFNYRLGPMGWFLHPALLSGDQKDDSGNFGTLDQIKLLEWVQHNIERFGGDKTNITLAGDSAGAQNVTYLMHSALAKDLFNKAIISSNYPVIRPASAAYKSSKQVLYNLMVADGLASDTAGAKVTADTRMSAAEIRKYLYGKSPEQLIKTFSNPDMGPIDSGDMFRDDIVAGHNHTPPPLIQSPENRPESIQIIGDGYVVPKGLGFADFSVGHVFPRPMIIGTTKNENHAFNARWPFNFQENKPINTLVLEAVNGTDPAYVRLKQFYAVFGQHDPTTFKENYTFATNLVDELHTYYGAQMPARNMAKISHAKEIPIYVYRFDWGSDPQKKYNIPFEDAWLFYNGSPHTSEYDFFYQNFFGLPQQDSPQQYQYTPDNFEGRKQLSLAIRSYLRGFFWNRNGRIMKNNDQPAEWKPWTASNEQYIVFDADHATSDVHMSEAFISRTPEQLYEAHASHANEAVRDFIEYAVLWGWCLNWYPNSAVGHFDVSPGPNKLFDPAKP
jgi:para-nitrobenzyl esterase